MPKRKEEKKLDFFPFILLLTAHEICITKLAYIKQYIFFTKTEHRYMRNVDIDDMSCLVTKLKFSYYV